MSRDHGGKIVLGVVVLHLLCCGLPLLLAAGALGGVGAALDNTALQVAAAAAVLAVVVLALRRMRGRRQGVDCCAPEPAQVPAQRVSIKTESR